MSFTLAEQKLILKINLINKKAVYRAPQHKLFLEAPTSAYRYLHRFNIASFKSAAPRLNFCTR